MIKLFSYNVLRVAPLCFLLSGCVYTKINIRELEDQQMSCGQITQEVSRLNKQQAEVHSARGFSGTNVLSAIFFWPGVLVNESNAEAAEKSIIARKEYLVSLYEQKGCPLEQHTFKEKEADQK